MPFAIMRLTDTLREEHVILRRAVDALEAMAAAARGSGAVDTVAAGDFLAFTRSFSDGLHHAKEEELLFPALERAGLPRRSGPIGGMLVEHDRGRELAAAMAEALARADEDSAEDFAEAAASYVELMRAHMRKEDVVLFVMAEQVLGDDENRRLLAGLSLAETGERRSRDAALAERLYREWLGERGVEVGEEQGSSKEKRV